VPGLAQTGRADALFVQVFQQPLDDKNEEFNQWLLGQRMNADNLKNPILTSEWDRLINDFKVFQSTPQKPTYQLKASLEEVKRGLLAQTQENLKVLSSLEKSLLALANRAPDQHDELLQLQFCEWGGTLDKITLDDVFVSLAQKTRAICYQKISF
jgi:hypothetical protein